MTPDTHGALIYVITDAAGTLVVALDAPTITGRAQRATSDGIVELDLLPDVVNGQLRNAAVSSDPPGLPDERSVAYLGGALSVAVGVGGWAMVTPWLGVPVGLVLGALVAKRYLRQEARIAARWRARHRTLDHYDDKSLFSRALSAAKTILASWPHILPLVQLGVPRDELAASLWSLTGLLSNRAELRTQQQSLQRARLDLPDGAAVGRDVEDRLARVDASLAELERGIKRRVDSLEAFARECVEFIRTEQAIARAREAVRRADLSLGQIPPPSTAAPDAGEDVAERTQAIMQAYRQLSTEQDRRNFA